MENRPFKEEEQISRNEVRGSNLQSNQCNKGLSPAADRMHTIPTVSLKEISTPAAEVKGDKLTLTPEVKEEPSPLTMTYEENISKSKEDIPFTIYEVPKLTDEVTETPPVEVDVNEGIPLSCLGGREPTTAEERDKINCAIPVNEASTLIVEFRKPNICHPKEELSLELKCEPTPNTLNGVLPSSSEVFYETSCANKEKTLMKNVNNLGTNSPTPASISIILDPSEEQTNDTIEVTENNASEVSQYFFEEQVGVEFIPEVDVVLASAAEMNLLVDLEVEDVLSIAAEVKELLTSSVEANVILSHSSEEEKNDQSTPQATAETQPSSKEIPVICMLSPSIEVDNKELDISLATEETYPSKQESEVTCIRSPSIEVENKEQHMAQPTEEICTSSKESQAKATTSPSIENINQEQHASPTQEEVYSSSKESSSSVLTNKETYNPVNIKTNSLLKSGIKTENAIEMSCNIGSNLEINAAIQPDIAPKRNATVLSEETSSKQCSSQATSCVSLIIFSFLLQIH